MTKQTIEALPVPEGYRLVQDSVKWKSSTEAIVTYHYEKIKPRRIVLEETGELRRAMKGEWYRGSDDKSYFYNDSDTPTTLSYKIFIEAEETDLSLTNDEPKLSLSVDECKESLTYAQPLEIARKMIEFTKDK